MVIGFALVSVVKEPDIAQVPNPVVGPVKESGEVASRFEDVRQPDHDREVRTARWKMGSV